MGANLVATVPREGAAESPGATAAPITAAAGDGNCRTWPAHDRRLECLQEEVRRLTHERDALLELRNHTEIEVHELRAQLHYALLWLGNLTNPGFLERRSGFASAVAEAYAKVQARFRAHERAMVERLTGGRARSSAGG
jgi:hypothetical protein